MTAAPRPLKAYSVQEEDEGTGGIVFARSSAEARRNGSCIFGDGDFNWGKARRTPWADQYAPGPVPQLVMLDHGWWFHCNGCGVRIGDDEQEDENGDPIEQKPIEVGTAIYCTTECRERHLVDRAEATRVQDEAKESLRAELLRRVPGAEIADDDPHRPHHAHATKVDGRYVLKQVIIYFTFPGCKAGKATFRFDEIGQEPQVYICNCDLEAWNAWREQVGASA